MFPLFRNGGNENSTCISKQKKKNSYHSSYLGIQKAGWWGVNFLDCKYYIKITTTTIIIKIIIVIIIIIVRPFIDNAR